MRVGYKLYREIRDFAPPDWTPAERVVAWVIADDASDATRASWIPHELLRARTGLSATGLRGALQRLASRGYEFRVIHGYGSDGRPVFATRGHAVDYVIPDVAAIHIGDTRLSPMPVDNPEEGDTRLSPSETGKATAIERKATAEPPKGDTRLSPLSSISSVTDSKTKAVNGSVTEPVDEKLSTGRPSKLETAAWHAAQSRRQRAAQERT
jgi:hypothetical protein